MITIPKKLAVEVWNVGVDFAAQLNTGETITGGFATVMNGTCTAGFIATTGSVLGVSIAAGEPGSKTIIEVGVITSAGETLAETLQVIVQ